MKENFKKIKKYFQAQKMLENGKRCEFWYRFQKNDAEIHWITNYGLVYYKEYAIKLQTL